MSKLANTDAKDVNIYWIIWIMCLNLISMLLLAVEYVFVYKSCINIE